MPRIQPPALHGVSAGGGRCIVSGGPHRRTRVGGGRAFAGVGDEIAAHAAGRSSAWASSPASTSDRR